MARSCICEGCPRRSLGTQASQLYCPVRFLWGRICQRVRTGERLFPSWTGQMFTNRRRNPATRFGRGGARRLGPCSVSKGAARAILESGGIFAQMLRACQWHSSAYRLYLDLGAEEAAAISRFSIEASGDEAAERKGPEGDPIPKEPRRLGSDSLFVWGRLDSFSP